MFACSAPCFVMPKLIAIDAGEAHFLQSCGVRQAEKVVLFCEGRPDQAGFFRGAEWFGKARLTLFPGLCKILFQMLGCCWCLCAVVSFFSRSLDSSSMPGPEHIRAALCNIVRLLTPHFDSKVNLKILMLLLCHSFGHEFPERISTAGLSGAFRSSNNCKHEGLCNESQGFKDVDSVHFLF